MRLEDSTTPVVVLHCALGALSIMRTLGYLGVPVYGVAHDPRSYALRSRYCRKGFIYAYHVEPAEKFVDFLVGLRTQFAKKPILIATSDETAIIVAEQYERLSEAYLIAQNKGDIVATLADKMTMFELARQFDVAAPSTFLPRSTEEAREYSAKVRYPVMLKGAMGNRLHQRTGKKMVVVEDSAELVEQYVELEDPERPNLMIQELIPGGDDEVYIFNGYFNKNSDCVVGFTGHKVRQFPIHVGCASLGECRWIQEVADITCSFMKRIGYRGVLDIGYRLDPRDGKYKVLDINPRVGQAFRLFVSEGDMDVVRALYMDMTGQPIPADDPSREGRRWMIEDYDLISTVHYFQEGTLSFGEWVKSFRRVEEGLWFSFKDPVPFVLMLGRLAKQVFSWAAKRVIPHSAPRRHGRALGPAGAPRS